MLWVKTSGTRRPGYGSMQRDLQPGAPSVRARPYLPERMFPPVRTRTRAALLRAMDRAIEFATLGEYGLEVPGADAPAPGTGRSASSVGRRPGAVALEGSPTRRVVAAQRAF